MGTLGQPCPRCNTPNEAVAFYCRACNAPMPGSAAYERERSAATAKRLAPYVSAAVFVIFVTDFLVRGEIVTGWLGWAMLGLAVVLVIVVVVALGVWGPGK